jgi:hypothetical protein
MKTNTDAVIAYIILKKLVTPITQTKAYELKLVNSSGRVEKVPETKQEKDALTILDKLIFKIKRMLGSKLQEFNSFLYLHASPEMYSKIVVNGDIKNRAEIKRIQKDIKMLQEDYQITTSEMITALFDS